MRWPWSRRPDPDPYCDVHTPALAHLDGPDGRPQVDLEATIANLQERLADGRMRLVRADCPLDHVLDVLRDERWLTMHLVFRCRGCGWLIDLALSPRSSFVPYDRVDAAVLETLRFHDSPLLVDNAPEVPLRLQ